MTPYEQRLREEFKKSYKDTCYDFKYDGDLDSIVNYFITKHREYVKERDEEDARQRALVKKEWDEYILKGAKKYLGGQLTEDENNECNIGVNLSCNSCGKIQWRGGIEMDTMGFRGICDCGEYLYEDKYKIIDYGRNQ